MPPKKRHVRLIHWNPGEAAERIRLLKEAGYRVDFDPDARVALAAIKASPPDAVVIDLSRLPMQGRDIGLDVRHRKSTRHVPIVFAQGADEKVARVRRQIPDAVYTSWRRIRSSLRNALAHPPSDPVAPRHVLAGYSGTPLPAKLGIKPDSTVDLAGAPEGFEKTLGDLPPGVRVRRGARTVTDVTLWFVKDLKSLKSGIRRMVTRGSSGGLWILWPKKASGVVTDVTQNDVRRTGLAAGLVDYKIAAIDTTWSGLKFSIRKKS